ncbi:MAG: nucleotide sugar dehydrogenase, partial [Nitrososphaeria archaeon]|nr:nucleotide sugar dehydrogenase [Nitrososphaeria archaeon]NIQ33740.1 nucleotide sugar dehydrogenase [Nitrososphaeria archaeon]
QKAMGEIGKSFQDTKTAVLGLAFRGDVADSRHSPAYDIVDHLVELHALVVVHDPFIEYDAQLASSGVRLVKSIEDAING